MTDETKPCPVCAESIKAAALKCRFCNTDLAAYAAEQEAAVERVLFHGHPVVHQTFGHWVVTVATLGLGGIYFWFRSRAITYTLTTHKIEIARGLLSTLEQTIELYRLDDFDVHRPLGMRLLGLSVLHVRSSDPDMPVAFVQGVRGLDTIVDQLRECALRDRQRRRVTTFVNA
ncbi:MAG: PH domain-containing protein [Acidobacteria bacterium]|nr:PH domain-containing protein [Acidobacteriota bacterium]